MSGAEALLSTLDRVQTALRGGDLAALSALAEEMERACDAGIAPANAEEARLLRARADRVAAGLMAAARGLRAARRRMAEIREAKRGVTTYDGRGARVTVGTEATRLRSRV